MSDEVILVVDRVKSISLATFGGGRKPSQAEADAGGAYMGRIMGKATGVLETTQVNKTDGTIATYQAIKGQFRAVLAEPKTVKVKDQDSNTVEKTIRFYDSGTLYLPSSFHADMMMILSTRDEASNKLKDTGNEIVFAYDVRTILSSSPAGYTYVMTPLVEEKKNGSHDIFAAIEHKAEKSLKALTAPAVVEGKKKAA